MLILAAFGWQLFEDNVKEMTVDVEKYQTHRKMDALWDANKVIMKEVYSSDEANEDYVEFKNTHTEWKHWSQLNHEEAILKNEKKWFSVLNIALYVLGSIMLILPKFMSKPN